MTIQEQQPLLSEKSEIPEHTTNIRRVEPWREHWVPDAGRGRSAGRFSKRVVLSALFGTVILGSLAFKITSQRGIFNCQKASTEGQSQATIKEESVASNYTCVPGQSCWPTASEWRAFNQSINGNLRLTVPLAAPCYAGSSSDECKQVEAHYMDGRSRTHHYGAMEFLEWETCGQSSCILNSFQPSSPVSGECSLGRLSTYHVEATSAEDISSTLDFVRTHGIRVSIKNTGHDYFGRSNAANSLAIWTHNMKDTKYHQTFQPQGCKAQYENIGEIGAGVQAHEAWEFFEPLNMLVTVGAVDSVGLAGGFGQGGGHGPLAPTWGLMVDNAIEFDIVTADGQQRTINECTDPDLFWAMRGGGGGTYAVLTSYKFQLHPAVPMNVYSFQASFPLPEGDLDISQSKAHKDIIHALALNQTSFAENGIAGYNFILPDHIVSLQVAPTSDSATFKRVTSQWADFASSYPGMNITDNSYRIFPTFSEWHTFTELPAIAQNGPVGLGIAESGRFIPKRLFSSPEDVEALVNAVVTAMQFSYTNRGGGSAQLYATGPFNTPDASAKTSAHPAWRDSLWEVIMGGIWTSNTPLDMRTQIQNTISASVQPFKALTPGGGCYVNEGDWMEENWEQTFFGANYDKLLDVKRRWDPSGLFNCWKCVGWTGYDDPMYSCYSQSRKTPNPSVPLGPVV